MVGTSTTTAFAAETSLAKASNFAVDGREAARRQLPILVLVSLPGCPYCESIRREHLLALAQETPPRVIARQVDMHDRAPLIDFDGARIDHAAFIRARQIKLAPTVALLGPDGAALVPPLVGALLPDFYGQYLDDAIAAARQRLQASPVSGPKEQKPIQN